MLPVLLADMIAAARFLAAIPASRRATETNALFCRAQIADKVMKRLRRPHVCWGNGSLMAATAGLQKRPESFASDPDFIDALLHILTFQNERLLRHMQKKSRRKAWTFAAKRYRMAHSQRNEARHGADKTTGGKC